ncbi:hypothetical protein BS78_K003800 [Paspalum vaginatum]|uniref:Uncharacterized protein n=1 Tax=Paspalum vaginatum TaxID=158149 RepID=A0A9W7XDF4_9POAL|nr:hypothetical protein BS78_K003800 [Paspalum vaginatum]KAJ1256578.1 hypothetical protein BS78_K003800 [Paspalum vaginatum]
MLRKAQMRPPLRLLPDALLHRRGGAAAAAPAPVPPRPSSSSATTSTRPRRGDWRNLAIDPAMACTELVNRAQGACRRTSPSCTWKPEISLPLLYKTVPPRPAPLNPASPRRRGRDIDSKAFKLYNSMLDACILS